MKVKITPYHKYSPKWERCTRTEGAQNEIRVFGSLVRLSLCPIHPLYLCICLLIQLAPISSSCSILMPLLQSRSQLCSPDYHGGFFLSFTSDSSLFHASYKGVALHSRFKNPDSHLEDLLQILHKCLATIKLFNTHIHIWIVLF